MRELDYKRYDVLVVDDEPDNLDAFRFAFRKSFRLHYAEGGDEALALIDSIEPAVIVADQRMPKMSGVELLRRVKERVDDVFAILLTAYAELDVLVDAVNSGAVDRYVPKPWESKEMALVLRQGIQSFVTLRENRRMREQLAQYAGYLDSQQRDPLDFGPMIAGGEATRHTVELIEEVAPTTTAVLVEGELGTEKDVVARAIHVASPREDRPFVTVTAAAFPGEALERELFGYRRQAFEGAFHDRAGRVELAHGGTLYLHEIGAITPSLQARLLRLIDEGASERIGETAPRAVDLRLVASSTPTLDEASPGLIPELRSRLSVFPIRLRPLRERKDDIRPLAEHFLRKHARRNAMATTEIAAPAVAALEAYAWPGNARELETVLERAAILARGAAIEPQHLELAELTNAAPSEPLTLSHRLDAIERKELLAALERHGGNKAEVARALGIHRTTLYYRLKKLGIDA